jgi:hypothetical protein
LFLTHPWCTYHTLVHRKLDQYFNASPKSIQNCLWETHNQWHKN